MPTAEIIVLAASKKLGGVCVAGVSTRTGRWARPVSDLEHGELEPAHCSVVGRRPLPLDVVRFAYDRELDDPAQPENLLLAEGRWRLVARLDPATVYERLASCISSGPRLLGNLGRAVPSDRAERGMASSLALVEPEEPTFKVVKQSERLRPRIEFALRGQRYDLGITDFEVGPRLQRAGEGTHELGELGFPPCGRLLLTISLGEPLDAWRWKLVAAVLRLP